MKQFSSFLSWALLLLVAILAFPLAGHDAAHAAVTGKMAFPLLAGTITIFDTRTMLQIIEQLKRPRTFLLDTFFPGFKTFDTAAVDIDIYKGKRRLAPFVAPVQEGKVMERLGYTTNSYKPPYIKPKMATTAGDILARQPGQVVYGTQSLAERAAAQLGRDLGDMLDSCTRREEWMAAQALNGGVINVVGEGVNDTINFQMASSHIVTLAGAALWTANTSDPIANLTTWARQCAQDSGLVPNAVVMGSDVANAFLARLRDPNYNGNGQLSTIKVQLGQIKPELLPNGVTFLGTLTAPSLNVDLFTYDEWYVDDTSGNEVSMVPVNKLFMGTTNAQNSKLYGAIQDMDLVESLGASLIAAPRVPKSWVTKDPGVRWVMVQSAPLVALNQPDAFLVATPI
jgi:hypothetical protein